MIAASFLMFGLGFDGHFGLLDGMILVAGLVLYNLILVKKSHDEQMANGAADRPLRPPKWFVQPILVLSGLGLLILGSRWFVDGAVGMARHLGFSELIIGLTFVAAGTSLPEAATSIVAAFRGQGDIAVGNVVGSNIFNILAVLGLSSLVSADGIPVPEAVLGFDIPVMIAVAVACLPIFLQDTLSLGGRELCSSRTMRRTLCISFYLPPGTTSYLCSAGPWPSSSSRLRS